jgi:hypothetical protein
VPDVTSPEEITDFLSEDGLRLLSALAFRPTQHGVRALEFVDLHSEIPVRKTTREYVGLTDKVLVPIAFPRRSELVDNIRIEASGTSVRSYTLGRELTIVAMRAVLLATARATELGSIPVADVEDICRYVPAAPTIDGMRLIDRLRTLLYKDRDGKKLDPDQVGLIGALQFFARRQPLLVPCVPDQLVLKLTYERDVTYLDMQHRGLREAARGALGRAPDYVRFNAPLATRAQSYHFRLRGPSDYFVRDVQCQRKLRTQIQHGERHAWAVYAALSEHQHAASGIGPNPTELAHLQLVNAGELAEARLGMVILVRLAERPLGRTGAALARLVIAALASLLLPIYGDSIVVGNTASVVSVLLGLPALLGASLIATRSVPRVRDPVLARIGSGIAVSSAIASSITLFVWTVSAASYKAAHPHLSAFSSFDAPPGMTLTFHIIAAVSVLASLNVLVALVRNSYRYIKALTYYRSKKRYLPT